ncbi:Hsp70 family chaperone [Colletotrichum sp. SAR 10_66]|nr:Hsp70 family chaperone [Colletotrichum sp. SAR 10_66]
MRGVPPTVPAANSEENVIVIGIDFGTTFSGVSWAWSGQPHDIEIVTRWKAQMRYNTDTEKTPSALLYRNGQDQPLWGYGIPISADQDPLKWFKLLLVDDNDLPRNVRDSPQITAARQLMKGANKDPVEVITDYLRCLWAHSIDSIRRSAGPKLVDVCKFHVVITLPAIWPDYSKARMRRAVQHAGMLEERWAGETTLSFISEPEAAALATVCDLGRRPNIEVGDHFVVCDAGGGTVDLISYEIVETDPLVVKEAVKGDGGLCGGVFLDEAFIGLMKRRMTTHIWNNLPKDEIKKLMNGDWEHGIKQQFEGDDQDWPVEVPVGDQSTDPSRRGIMKKKNLILTSDDLKPVFDGVADEIVYLVQKQIAGVVSKSGKEPKYVMLVGGFGRCQYLGIRLESAIDSSIEILQSQGPKPWTAICRGAVIAGLARRNRNAGLSVAVKSRIARFNYGIKLMYDFNPRRHLDEDKYWDMMEEKYRAINQTQWFIRMSIRRNYHKDFVNPPSVIQNTFYYSAILPAPTRGDKTVKNLCTITWTKSVDWNAVPRRTNSKGLSYYMLSYQIEMVCDGTSLDFTVFYDDKPVGAKNVSVDFEPFGGEAGCPGPQNPFM